MVSRRILLALPAIIPSVTAANEAVNPCNFVNVRVVVGILKFYQATSFCSNFLQDQTSTVVSIVPATSVTTTTEYVATETDVITEPSTSVTTELTTIITTVTAAPEDLPTTTAIEELLERRNALAPPRISLRALSLISRGCSCLNIPQPSTITTTTSTSLQIVTDSVTTTTQTTLTTIIPSTELSTSTIEATCTTAPTEAPANPNSCDHPQIVCGESNQDCDGFGTCGFCLNSADMGPVCGKHGTCNTPCLTDDECGADFFCAQDTCCEGGVCAALAVGNPCVFGNTPPQCRVA